MDGPAGAQGGDTADSEAGAPVRRLIVDDHPVVRDGLSSMFARDPGFEVLGEAPDDAAAAVRLAQTLRRDVRCPGRGPWRGGALATGDGPADERFLAPGAGPLSQRELKVLELVAAGTTNREAAAGLFITEATVKTHPLNIYAKLGGDRAAAVAEAFNRGLLTPGRPGQP